jgi:DNA-binding CsgD family transcriptional regulator
MNRKLSLCFALCSLLAALCFAQVASRTDGVTVFYYNSLHEAFNAAAGVSIDQPDEITLLADLVLDAPLTLDNGVHIRLVPGGGGGFQGGPRTLRRSPTLIEYPVIWVNGDSSSLSLGKPGMEFELIIDGGCLNSQPIEAYAPLVAITGLDSKLIMYDKATLQNNINAGNTSTASRFPHGAGVFIFTRGNTQDRQAEFIMKGGTIRGNTNKVKSPIPCGGGVMLFGFGIFTMEGGVIMNNTAYQSGGGLYMVGTSFFKKTGGIIYGSNAPAAYRNTALVGLGIPPAYGHSVAVAEVVQLLAFYREDTVGENDNLTFSGAIQGPGTVGKGEKWDTNAKALLRMALAIGLPVLALTVCVILIYRKKTLQKLMRIAQEAKEAAEAADQSANISSASIFRNMNLTSREKEISVLLLTKLSIKQIATVMHIAYTTADYHSKKVYLKMGVESRTELLTKSRGAINK